MAVTILGYTVEEFGATEKIIFKKALAKLLDIIEVRIQIVTVQAGTAAADTSGRCVRGCVTQFSKETYKRDLIYCCACVGGGGGGGGGGGEVIGA